MRCRLAQIVALAVTCILTAKTPIHAQSRVSKEVTVICPPLSVSDDPQPSEPKISIAKVSFSGALKLPISDQRLIATSIKQRTSGSSFEAVVDEATERAKAEWQNRGYFKVQVSGDSKTLSGGPVNKQIVLNLRVDEGLQYRLGEITFRNNKAIRDDALLRGLFPIKNGDIFRPREIAKGLENLRRAYGERGYLNFTSAPETLFDDETRLISVVMDIDEGKQFHVNSVNIIGLDEHFRQEILKDFPIGQVYSPKVFRLFLEKYSAAFKLQPDDPRLTERHLDEKEGTISITLYACPCPVC